ncbi:MAG: hypothetical protein MZU95_10790 [Desulfomicrobium escambiense]|nr:hypothetical protein [Desulfomicrobium escambiense]
MEPESFGAALQYFTGSQAHNIAVRRIGRQRGLKINEYGVFSVDGKVAGETEESVYRALELALDPARAARGPRRDRGRPRGAAAGAGRARPTSRASFTPTPPPPTAATAWRRWRSRPSAAG